MLYAPSESLNEFIDVIFARGGKGKKYSYKVTYLCPSILLLESVKRIVNRYKSELKRNDTNNLTLYVSNLNESIKTLKKVLCSKKLFSVSLADFLTRLYEHNVNYDGLK